MTIEAVLDHHRLALFEGVDAVMSDYDDRAVLFTPEGPVRGRAHIRAFYDQFLKSAPPGLLQALTVLRQDVDGETAYLLWKAEPFVPLATDTFVIRDGKIVSQSYALLAPTPAAA